MSARLTLRAEDHDHGERVDVVLARHTDLSRARAQHAVQGGRVFRRGIAVDKPSLRVESGDTLEVELSDPAPAEAAPEDIPLRVVFEDEAIIVVDKPPGLVVHPAPGHPSGTLVNALLHHCDDLTGVGDALRPGLVHRIDRQTSGLLVVAKSDAALAALQPQFAAHTVRREYWAICARVSGRGLLDQGTFDTRHGRHATDRKRFTGQRGSRRAVTHYSVLRRFEEGAMLVACRLETGRTHQIRVHLSEAGAPILGDELYAPPAAARSPLVARLALHARTLGFTHPDGRTLDFEAPLPDDLTAAIARLDKGASWRR
ncbi:MAG: RluA family pseudouridine synthase [Myxococcales bacterium]|nr:RluA family pseudouridine synthase [Myxococcales bacterium]